MSMELLKTIKKLEVIASELLIQKQNYEAKKSELDGLKQDIESKLEQYADFQAREKLVNEKFLKVRRDEDFEAAAAKLVDDRNAFFAIRDKGIQENAEQKKKNDDDRAANADRAETLGNREKALAEEQATYRQQIQEELVFKMTGLRPSEVLKPATVAEAAPVVAGKPE